MKSIAVEFKNFSFKYRAQAAPTLTGINLTLYKGEKVLIAGRSGSGKSTLVHLINGLIPFSYDGEISGTLTINGQDPGKLGLFGLSKHVGTVLQDTDSQFVGLTVGEDIAFALENDCIVREELHRRVNDSAKTVGMAGHLAKSPQALSGGQKQRVSMAGVLIDEVSILLFDEPLANLDPAAGKHAMELIDRIHSESGATIIIIEHRVEDVLHCPVDRLVVVDEGKIIGDGPPDAILSSGLLPETGIREPLYLSALSYAGQQVDASHHPSSIEKLCLEPFTQGLRSWYEKTPVSPPPAKTVPQLVLKNVCFGYRENAPLLKSISLTLNKGEMVSLAGTNGAGKSTLSKVICGFEKAQAGEILLEGRDISKEPIGSRAEKIGLVMQNPNHMIIKPMLYDEVALGLVSRGMAPSQIKEQVEKTLKICGLYPFRNWPVSALSYGQKKRVTLASILVLEPSILILDEPTAGQDYRHYTEFMEYIVRINRETDTSLFIITHDMHLILEYTTRTLVMDDGCLIADDSPAAVLTNDSLIEKASLKRTSLYDLSRRAGIEDGQAFVQHFIDFDRRKRAHA